MSANNSSSTEKKDTIGIFTNSLQSFIVIFSTITLFLPFVNQRVYAGVLGFGYREINWVTIQGGLLMALLGVLCAQKLLFH